MKTESEFILVVAVVLFVATVVPPLVASVYWAAQFFKWYWHFFFCLTKVLAC